MPPWFRRSSVQQDDDFQPRRLKTLLSSLIQASSEERLGLPSRQPVLKDVAHSIQIKLDRIISASPMDVLSSHAHFRPCLIHIEQCCRKTLQIILQTDVPVMANPQSVERVEVIRQTRVLYHIVRELMTHYPHETWSNNTTFCLPEAKVFWKKVAGDMKIVPWGAFMDALAQKFGSSFKEGNYAELLKEHLDLCDDGYISCWEFDVFTQLYQPWDMLLSTWSIITQKHPGYKAWMTFEEVEQTLQPFRHISGSYVFRKSANHLGKWTIGYIDDTGHIRQSILEEGSLFQNLVSFAAKGICRHPMGNKKNIDPRDFVELDYAAVIEVTDEQSAAYAAVNSTFETCKICLTASKEVRIEPCNHLLCKTCLDNWIRSNRTKGVVSCPFCRGQVKNTHVIIFNNNKSDMDNNDNQDIVVAPFTPPPERSNRNVRRIRNYGRITGMRRAASVRHATQNNSFRYQGSGKRTNAQLSSSTMRHELDGFNALELAAPVEAGGDPRPARSSQTTFDEDIAEAVRRSLVDLTDGTNNNESVPSEDVGTISYSGSTSKCMSVPDWHGVTESAPVSPAVQHVVASLPVRAASENDDEIVLASIPISRKRSTQPSPLSRNTSDQSSPNVRSQHDVTELGLTTLADSSDGCISSLPESGHDCKDGGDDTPTNTAPPSHIITVAPTLGITNDVSDVGYVGVAVTEHAARADLSEATLLQLSKDELVQMVLASHHELIERDKLIVDLKSKLPVQDTSCF